MASRVRYKEDYGIQGEIQVDYGIQDKIQG